jgi:hypothetical protein
LHFFAKSSCTTLKGFLSPGRRFFGLGLHADSSIRENARRERGLCLANVAVEGHDEATNRIANPVKGQEQSNSTRAAGLRLQIISAIASFLPVALGLGLLYTRVAL